MAKRTQQPKGPTPVTAIEHKDTRQVHSQAIIEHLRDTAKAGEADLIRRTAIEFVQGAH